MPEPPAFGSVLPGAWSAALIIILLGSCAPSTPEQRDERIIARLGSDVLTHDEAFQQLGAMIAVADSIDQLERFQRDWIERRLLIDHATEIGITQTNKFDASLNRLRDDLIMEHLLTTLESEAEESIEVTTEEAAQFYEQNKDKFTLQEPWLKIRHHEASGRDSAAAARQGLLRGEDWADLSERYAVDAERQISSATEFIPLSTALGTIPELNRALRRMGVSEISNIVEHEGTWHVVQIVERREAGSPPDLEWIISEVGEWLKQEKKRRYVNAYIRTLYLEAEISNRLYKRDLTNEAPSTAGWGRRP